MRRWYRSQLLFRLNSGTGAPAEAPNGDVLQFCGAIHHEVSSRSCITLYKSSKRPA
jgi:hypothetical protein